MEGICGQEGANELKCSKSKPQALLQVTGQQLAQELEAQIRAALLEASLTRKWARFPVSSIEACGSELPRPATEANNPYVFCKISPASTIIEVPLILWMDEIRHHFKTIGNHCLLVFAWDSSFYRFPGDAGFRPSTVASIFPIFLQHPGPGIITRFSIANLNQMPKQ